MVARLALVVIAASLGACQGKAEPPARPPATRGRPLVVEGCTLATSAPRLAAPNPTHGPTIVTAWTPFATIPVLPAPGLGERTRGAISPKLGQLQLCAPPTGDGSVRAMLRIASTGTVVAARVGGLGDAKAETCIGSALVQLETGATSLAADTEVACDFTIGAKQPWRVTPSAAYASDPATAPADRVLLVQAAPAATFEAVGRALEGATRSPAVLIAQADGRLLGVGGTRDGARVVAVGQATATICPGTTAVPLTDRLALAAIPEPIAILADDATTIAELATLQLSSVPTLARGTRCP